MIESLPPRPLDVSEVEELCNHPEIEVVETVAPSIDPSAVIVVRAEIDGEETVIRFDEEGWLIS
jgi:hypothetical protein